MTSFKFKPGASRSRLNALLNHFQCTTGAEPKVPRPCLCERDSDDCIAMESAEKQCVQFESQMMANDEKLHENQVAESQVAGSQVAGTRVAESLVVGSQAAESQVTGSQAAESQVAGSQAAGSQVAESQAAGSQAAATASFQLPAPPKNTTTIEAPSEIAGEKAAASHSVSREDDAGWTLYPLLPCDVPNITELPPKPQEPLPEDCCGSGCVPCVTDIYEQELRLWKEECRRIRAGVLPGNPGQRAISPEEYSTFQLVDITPESCDTCRYRFAVPGGTTLHLQTGQHLVMRWKAKGVTRQYTPLSGQDLEESFQVIIKTYPKGQMSAYIREWRVGDMVEWRGPFGNFNYLYAANKYRQVVILAAGTGIAPMTQVCNTVLDNAADETRLLLMYCCHTYDDILCKEELNDWKDYWNFKAIYFLSQGAHNTCRPRHRDEVINSRLSQSHLQQYLFAQDAPHGAMLVLICGTRSFDQDMLSYVRELGIRDEQIFKF